MRLFMLSICLMFLSVLSITHADVIKLHDGRIILGKVIAADSGGIDIESFGEKKRISNGEVLKTEQNISGIKDARMEMVLKGGSVLSGKINNYDEEIGVLLNIGFGNLTIPVGSIEEIRDPVVTRKYSGYATRAGGTVSGYMVMGGLSSSYESSAMASAFAEFRLPWLRGLYAGIDLAYRHLRYNADSDMKYRNVALKPYLMYSFYEFHNVSSITEKITPFVQLYSGPSYITLEDDRAFAKSNRKNEIDLEVAIAAGFDFLITGDVSIRVGPSYSTIFQKSSSFSSVALVIGVYYGF